ncbi:MAG: sigma-54-dependent Fis family transcriptional regulator [Deltaproteobacteria bacterium]|nr:sigma-54-dependent Fis family transcriptional regulator [Deltaproteobacteria bacterium]
MKQRRALKFNSSAVPKDLVESDLFGYVIGSHSEAKTDKIGKFKAADNGFLFLDEIGDMDYAVQRKILIAIEYGEITPVGSNVVEHVTLIGIFATNRNLEQMIEDGTFGDDLYERISQLEVRIPPLRERKGDIKLLLEHFLNTRDGARRDNLNLLPLSYSEGFLLFLEDQEWKRNVRQLRNVIDRAIFYHNRRGRPGTLTIEDLSDDFDMTQYKKNKGEIGKYHKNKISGKVISKSEIYRQAFIDNDGWLNETARQQGVSPKTISNNIPDYAELREKLEKQREEKKAKAKDSDKDKK